MTDRHVLRLDEGGEIEVLPDIRGGKPVVVLFTKCVYVTDGERLEIAGVVLNLTERMEYTVRTNVLLDEEVGRDADGDAEAGVPGRRGKRRVMRDFVKLPDVPAQADLDQAREALDSKNRGEVREAGRKVLSAYGALLARVRLAELALHRARLLADDMQAEIERGKTRRSGPPSPAGIANMARSFVQHYVDPIQEPLREALGYEEGDAEHGWYQEPEEVRAKLVGNIRAKERLAREGKRGMP